MGLMHTRLGRWEERRGLDICRRWIVVRRNGLKDSILGLYRRMISIQGLLQKRV